MFFSFTLKFTCKTTKIFQFPTLAGTKLPFFSFSPPPNFVHTILSAASEKWVASSGSTPEVFLSLLLSFCSFPSTSFIMALFMDIRVKRHLSPLNRTKGRFSRSSRSISPHSRYLSDCGGSAQKRTDTQSRSSFLEQLAQLIFQLGGGELGGGAAEMAYQGTVFGVPVQYRHPLRVVLAAGQPLQNVFHILVF